MILKYLKDIKAKQFDKLKMVKNITNERVKVSIQSMEDIETDPGPQ